MRNIFLAFVLVSVIMIGLWTAYEHSIKLPSSGSEIESLSYAPYKGFNREILSEKEIRKDLEILSKYTKKIRLYAASEALRILPIAKEKEFMVDLGIWIGTNRQENKKEIDLAKKLLKEYSEQIDSVIVGNETLLREDVTIKELKGYIKEILKSTGKPVTTAEVWHTWEKHPDLAYSVDFITVHILPYWEYTPADDCLAFVKEKYDLIANKYPTKFITIGEFGWPSQGYNNKAAIPTPQNQAKLISNFLILAAKEGWNYNIVEAFDQPWKGNLEGSAGPYWGVFKEDRSIKFSFAGLLETNPYWVYLMIANLILGFIFAFYGLKNLKVNFAHAFTYTLASQGMAFGIIMAIGYPIFNYLNAGMWIMWGVGLFLMIPLTVITLAKVNELFKCTVGWPPERLVPLNLKSDRVPFVSIHLPAYKEQPHVLMETLDALAKLDYTNYEVLVIINNTPEEYYWKPIEAYCKELGGKFKFLNITCTGFKAGALNVALNYTDKEAEIVALIDADYVVDPNWLVDLVPLFDDPKVAIVQAPQDHRDGDESIFKTAMNSEYAGFFDIGMVERNEANAIVVHGTMLMVKLKAMLEVGGWGTDTIVEDSELGLRLFEAGYIGHYTNRRYGHGLLPDTLEAFKTQRHRWAYGAIQILKKHWKHFKPSSTTLTSEQKHHFIAGWFFWLSDAFGPLMAIMNIIWVPVIIFIGATIPTIPLTVPILTAFGVNLVHAFVLYKTRVQMKLKNTFLGTIAAMSLQLIIFKAVFEGFVKDGLPFKRTEKGGNSKKSQQANPIKYELILTILLITSAIGLILTNTTKILEVYFFAATLLVQSIPYISAICLRLIEVASMKNKKPALKGQVLKKPL